MPSTLAYLAEAERRGATGHTGPLAGKCNCDLCWRSPNHFIPPQPKTKDRPDA